MVTFIGKIGEKYHITEDSHYDPLTQQQIMTMTLNFNDGTSYAPLRLFARQWRNLSGLPAHTHAGMVYEFRREAEKRLTEFKGCETYNDHQERIQYILDTARREALAASAHYGDW